MITLLTGVSGAQCLILTFFTLSKCKSVTRSARAAPMAVPCAVCCAVLQPIFEQMWSEYVRKTPASIAHKFHFGYSDGNGWRDGPSAPCPFVPRFSY